jgi:hypothetical protein
MIGTTRQQVTNSRSRRLRARSSMGYRDHAQPVADRHMLDVPALFITGTHYGRRSRVQQEQLRKFLDA